MFQVGMQPGAKSTAPILISLPINGQSTTVLLDPITMQVLGTVQPGQQTPGQLPTGVPPAAAPLPVSTQAPVTPIQNVPTSTAAKGKGKNNQNQRAICPKPLGTDGGRAQGGASKKKKSKAKNKEAVPPDSLSDSLQIQIPESTTDPETASAISSESTDILAKAAESIFSSPSVEVSAVGGFYNPANEDNPLHIDTSVTEGDEEKKSPVKQLSKSANTSKSTVLHDNVLGLNSVADGALAVKVSGSSTKVVMATTKANNANVTSLSETLEEIAGINFPETSVNSSFTVESKSRSDVEKSVKKSKGASKNDDDKKDGSKGSKSGNVKSKSGSSKKQAEETKSVIEMEKMESDSQMELESTLIHIPDEISFSAKDLSDMLDQVEQMGSSGIDSPSKNSTPTAPAKKSKSKRSKPADPETEPNAKKRKSGKETGKDSKPSKAAVSRELLSMPTNLSVYDFDDSDDMVPSILPLNGKDFTGISGTTPMKTSENSSSENMDVAQKTDYKSKGNNPNTAKSKSTASHQKPVKGNTNNKPDKEVEAVSNKHTTNEQMANATVSVGLDSKKPAKNNTKTSETKTDPSVPSITPEAALSSVDSETTTSIFGFPVTKKQQKVETSTRQNTNTNKNTSHISPKPSPQPTTQMLSPKSLMVSPKSQPSSVSPSQNNAFSPEMVSPKLNIVSPGQGMMSDSDVVSPSPKHSPIKKRSPAAKMESVKVSSFSALNSVPETVYSNAPVSKFNDKPCLPLSTIGSQQAGVITNPKPVNTQNNIGEVSKPPTALQNIPVKVSEPSGVNATVLPDKNNMVLSNNSSNMSNQKPPIRNQTYTNMDTNTNNVPPPPNVTPTQRPPVSTVKSSQNTRYGPPYGNDPSYGHMPGMNVNPSMANDPGQPCTNMGNYPSTYSSESLFNPQAEKVIKSPPNVNISTLNQQKPEDQNMMKMRSNPYSVDNFVESSRDDGMRQRPDTLNTHPGMNPGMIGGELNNPSTDFSRLQNESSPDGFNFANIGLNLQPITSTAGNYMENSSSGPANMPSSFSFSLSSTSTTVSTTSSSIGHHQFPFFPPMLSSASNVPSSQSALPSSMPNMDMFNQSRPTNDQVQRNNPVMHPPPNSVPRPDKSQSAMSDDSNPGGAHKPSCSKQKLAKAHGTATIQEPFQGYNSSNSGHDGNYFHDAQMKSNVGKSPTEQMRKPPDKPMDIGSSQSRSSSQSTIPDKRVSNMDRSPQMMNNQQSYYPHPSKSLSTNPLHHPMMPPDERVRNITNRSPYENPFPPPPASQVFNQMGQNFPSNRFDNGPPSFSRDNSGTQPLSHTPVNNASGRKSANPPASQTSVVKPPQKQTAPPLVPMQQPPTQVPRPTPPQSHRATTPHGSQSQAAPSQVNQSRQSKQPSRNSKPPSSSKKNKSLAFMEVDSNLSNSIFEPNRSMTPFFPMQNLSPQSRAIQHEGPPFLPGNIFGSGPRFANSNAPMPKNSDIGPPFNPLFPGRGAQNSLGLGFQPGFGMNMNPLHGNHGNGPQLPHTAPHMANFSLNSIFTDSASQNESMSPIKFPHTNYQGMEHNPMQHHHQYNRGHPSVMSINSILGSNPHGFDGRMPTSMAGPFHSHGHPSLMPPFNFSMHDH